jgi:hypothetical protein
MVALLLTGCDMLFQIDHVDLVDAPIRPDSALPPWKPAQPLSTLNAPATSGDHPIETDASMTGDGLEIYFGSDRGKVANDFDIYVATRPSVSEPFGTPVLVPELTTTAAENGYISVDGKTFYMTRVGMNGVLVSSRANRGGVWSAPVQQADLSVLIDGANPAISVDGLSFLVNSAANGGDLFLYSRNATTDPWELPRQLMEISSPMLDGAGSFDGTGLTMVFHTEREGAVRKIYETSRPSRTEPFSFSSTFPITEVGGGSDPWLSPDARTLVFLRDGDLYMTTR